jgi:ectoine hydroxylase-related dioxygenase (phytanoyl-CoA dioxygenase family)
LVFVGIKLKFIELNIIKQTVLHPHAATMDNKHEYAKYTTTLENVRETLETYGVAILPHVLDDQECENMFQGCCNAFEYLTQKWDIPITMKDPTSWVQYRDLYPIHSMILQHFGIGHAQYIWDIRQNPKCIAPFAQLWNCVPDELLVSFDAISMHFPPETTGYGWFGHKWYHTDQSYLHNDFECVQGWVTALDVNEGDGTLAIIEGSHLYHKEFAETIGIRDIKDYYKLNEEELAFYLEKCGCQEKYIVCPKGSVVLWDSRLIHCGIEPRRGRRTPNFRCIAYLCYMPRKGATAKQLEKKIQAFENMRMTTHWPTKSKLFGKWPQTYGAVIKETTPLPRPIVKTALGLRLIGY